VPNPRDTNFVRQIWAMLALLVIYFVLIQVAWADCSSPYPDAWVPDGYCAEEFAKGLSAPRHIEPVSNGDILVVESGLSQVTGMQRSLLDASHFSMMLLHVLVAFLHAFSPCPAR
jgi:hypothetical protein